MSKHNPWVTIPATACSDPSIRLQLKRRHPEETTWKTDSILVLDMTENGMETEEYQVELTKKQVVFLIRELQYAVDLHDIEIEENDGEAEYQLERQRVDDHHEFMQEDMDDYEYKGGGG